MCTRFVYNGKETIVGFNFDIDLSEWEHTVIAEKDRFFIGIKMSDNKYHSFHGINRNGNVGTLLYVHGNDNAQFCGNESCYTIADLTENFIKGNLSFDDSLEIVKKKKITYAPDTTMQAMFSDRNGRVLIIEPGIGYRLEKEKYSLITNYSILKPELTNPYVLSGDNRYEKAKDLLQGYGENFSIVKPSHKVACLTCKHAIWSIFEPFDHIKSQQNIDTQKMEEAQIRCYCPLMHLISWAKTTTEVTLCNGPHKD